MTHTFDPTLPQGWDISPRLMARFTLSDSSTIEVATEYRVVDAAGRVVAEGCDFSPGMSTDTWHGVLATFLGFLGYYAQGCDHDEPAGCPFPAGFHEWCAEHEYEIEDQKCVLDPEGVW